MEKIKELIANYRNDLLKGLSKDTPKEEIDKINGMKAKLDEIEQEADKNIKEKQEITEMYVNAVKSSGSTTPEDDGAENVNNPKTLEERIAEALKDNK